MSDSAHPDGCGCEQRGQRLFRCQYHQGWVDGRENLIDQVSLEQPTSECWPTRIPGRAVPKARARVVGSRAYTPARTLDWEERVGWAWREAYGQTLLKGSLAVELVFVGRCRGDLDNLAKGCLDALNGIAYDDDGQVDELHVRRVRNRGEEYVALTVRRL